LTSHILSGFFQGLHYTDGPGVPCYNGNISSMQWTTGTTTSDSSRGYHFAYDGLNRLKNAVYGEGSQLQTNADRLYCPGIS
ncbi:hypothetical protein, partial [Bacteroides acidifaciens]|uniref:hypothetical protein n=2 Tax=Bacteroides acidifaciens TaxID=85831 RepID=UPI001892B343